MGFARGELIRGMFVRARFCWVCGFVEVLVCVLGGLGAGVGGVGDDEWFGVVLWIYWRVELWSFGKENFAEGSSIE